MSSSSTTDKSAIEHKNENIITKSTSPKIIHNHSKNDNTIVKTSSLSKNSLWFFATIESVSCPTPTVTCLSIRVHPSSFQPPPSSSSSSLLIKHNQYTDNEEEDEDELLFSFHPGQWIDFYIPELEKIGGYSITSIPSQLPIVELAVKASCHPPAHWVTTKASLHDLVKVRVGGDFIYDATTSATAAVAMNDGHVRLADTLTSGDQVNSQQEHQQQLILFIGGGVGINPLYGMLRQILENVVVQQQQQQQQQQQHEQKFEEEGNVNQQTTILKAALLYSVSNEEERLFGKELMAMEYEFPDHFKMYFTSTDKTAVSKTTTATTFGSMRKDDAQLPKERTTGNSRTTYTYNNGRISATMVENAIEWLQEAPNEKVNKNHHETALSSIAVSGVYICGPPGMAEEMSTMCIDKFHIDEDNIHYEKWW